MSVVKHFIEDSIKKAEIDEFLQNEFERAGYGGVSITKTPLGTHLVIYTMRPGIVIGRGGETIRALATVLEENFQLPSPQISVAEIEIPELNAYVVASRIASALKRGVHYRRAGFWGLNQIMDAGALGAEIIISGKLRTDRARYEKFRAGYLPKSGEPPRKYMRKAELHVQLKPGILGVKVRLIPPDSEFPDQVQVQILDEELEKETEEEIVKEKAVTEEKAVKPAAPEKAATEKPESESAVPPAEEKAKSKKEKATEKKAPTSEDKAVTEEKDIKVKTPATEEKVVNDEKVSETKTPSAEKKPVEEKKAEPKATKPKVSATKEKAASKKKAAKTKTKPVKKKKVTKKKATKEKVAKKKVSSAKEKAAPKKKATKTKATSAKKTKKAPKKKVAKAKASAKKQKKEAEE
jgi:small subunit ribosomal protein S3